ncbi:MAG: hypothetical protein ACI8WB_005437 [Phenylobacterium sp.]|jgi:hypothetical protein
MGLSIISIKFKDKPPSRSQVIDRVAKVTGIELLIGKRRIVSFKRYPNEKTYVYHHDKSIEIHYQVGLFYVLPYVLANAYIAFGGQIERDNLLEKRTDYWQAISAKTLHRWYLKHLFDVYQAMLLAYGFYFLVLCGLGYAVYWLTRLVFQFMLL